jgi:tryptophanyl-tRNA synthetase
VTTKKRVVSGMRPTGKLHLGHLVGALHNWAAMQATHDCYYFVADWHALTSHYADTADIVANAIDNVADWIGAGIDPERSTIFIQSLVPEHAELYLLLQMVTPIPWLERVRQMYTDPNRVRADIPGTVEGNPVFTYHDAFNHDTAQVEDLKARYRAGKVGDVEVKTKLATAINGMLEPIRARRAEALARPGYLRDVAFEGSKKAREVACQTMERVRSAVRLKY